MNMIPEYTIAKKPVAQQKLTSLHWQCYHAVDDGKVPDFVSAEVDSKESLDCAYLLKIFADLERFGLIAPAEQGMSHDEWIKRQEDLQKGKSEARISPSAPPETVNGEEKPAEVVKDQSSVKKVERVTVDIESPAEEPDSKVNGSVVDVAPVLEEAPAEEEVVVAGSVEVVRDEGESIDVKEVQRKRRSNSVSLDF